MRIAVALIAALAAWIAYPANLLENSSFECGDLRGWSRSAYGQQQSVPWYRTNNPAPQHGSYCVRIDPGTATGDGAMVSRLYRLKPSTTYILSVYARRDDTTSDYAQLDTSVSNSRTSDAPVNGPGDVYSTGHHTLGTSWTRYTNIFTTASVEGQTTYYVTLWNDHDSLNYIYLDAVMLEEGSAPSAFEPITTVEIGTLLDRATPGHVYYSTGSAAVKLVAANFSGSTATVNANWKLYDYANALVGNGTASFSAADSAVTTNSITMPSLGNGFYRCLIWTTNINESITEATYAVVSQPVTITRTNSFIGSHVPLNDWSLGTAQRLGVHWNRLMSTDSSGEWIKAEPTEGAFVIDTNKVALSRTYDIEPLMELGINTGSVPVWATNGNAGNWPDGTKWSNFVFRIVSDYKPFCKYFEVWNEQCATNNDFTNVMVFGAGAIRTADATAVVVAPADYYQDNVHGILHLLGDGILDIWSTHIYPDTGNDSSVAATSAIMSAHSKTGFNSETGYRFDSAYSVPLWEELQIDTSLLPTALGYTRNYRMRLPQQLDNVFATLAGQIRTYFYYDFRNTGGHNGLISFSEMDFNHTVKPMAAAYATVASLFDGGTPVGRIDLGSSVRAWCWTRDSQCILAVLSTNLSSTNTLPQLKLTTSLSAGQFSIRDVVGKTLIYSSGVYFGRDPIYLVGAAGISTNDVIASVTISVVADSQAPNLSMVTWPTTGLAPARYTYRWRAFDNCDLDTRDVYNESAIQYRSILIPHDSAWSIWTNACQRTYTDLNPSTSYRFIVQAKDAAGNTSQDSYPEQITTCSSSGKISMEGKSSL